MYLFKSAFCFNKSQFCVFLPYPTGHPLVQSYAFSTSLGHSHGSISFFIGAHPAQRWRRCVGSSIGCPGHVHRRLYGKIWKNIGVITTIIEYNPMIWWLSHYNPITYMGLSENRLVPHCTQWFCWSLSLWKMAISLGVYPIFRQSHILGSCSTAGFFHLRFLNVMLGIHWYSTYSVLIWCFLKHG